MKFERAKGDTKGEAKGDAKGEAKGEARPKGQYADLPAFERLVRQGKDAHQKRM